LLLGRSRRGQDLTEVHLVMNPLPLKLRTKRLVPLTTVAIPVTACRWRCGRRVDELAQVLELAAGLVEHDMEGWRCPKEGSRANGRVGQVGAVRSTAPLKAIRNRHFAGDSADSAPTRPPARVVYGKRRPASAK